MMSLRSVRKLVYSLCLRDEWQSLRSLSTLSTNYPSIAIPIHFDGGGDRARETWSLKVLMEGVIGNW